MSFAAAYTSCSSGNGAEVQSSHRTVPSLCRKRFSKWMTTAALRQLLGLGERGGAVVGMDELQIRSGQQLGFGPAEDARPGGVEPLEVAVKARDGQHVERQLEEAVELLLCPPPIDEHPDLIADGRQRRQQALVDLPNLAAEELHDAEDLAVQQHGEAKRGVQAFAIGDGRARKVRVAHDIRDPGGLTAWPRRGPGRPAPRRNRMVAADGVELGKVRGRRGPDLRAAQDVGLVVDDPQGAMLPADRRADGLEDLGSRFVEAWWRRRGRARRRTRR